MNIHHLELFFYVARYGGISEAVRNIPYGIQQPAVSAQVIQLEEHLGVTLFHRRPFALTPAGEELYQFSKPFFSNLDAAADKLRGGAGRSIRIGASEVVQRDHLPEVVLNVRQKYPKLKLYLREGYRPQLEAWLQQQELDLAITVIEGKPPSGIHTEELIQLHLALIVPKPSPIQSGADLWERDKIDEPLIALPAAEAVCRHFQQALAKRGLDWFTSLEVSSLGLVETYVANGFGIGLGLHIPKTQQSARLRFVPLTEFPPVLVGAMWTGKRTPLMSCFIDECHRRARYLRA
ncbi:MAG: LysR family transcriptional regulator [Verrucomicrobia bacterium]|nr:LysR family transcriptional regulator [Verrucomicrobiota bacterium]